MNLEQLCDRQRQKEKKTIRFYLIFGLIASSCFHFIVIDNFNWSAEKQPKKTKKTIEFILVDPPKQKLEKPVEKEIEQPKPTPVQKTVPQAQTPLPTLRKPTPTPPVQKTVPQAQTPLPTLRKSTPTPVQKTVPQPNLPSSPAVTNQSNSTAEQESNSDRTNSNPVAANTDAIDKPQKKIGTTPTISCVSNCKPQYPSVLNGKEGSAAVRVAIDSNGNVTGVQLARANPNFKINQQALYAAKKMRFTAIGDNQTGTVIVNIGFTVAGSDFDRQRRQAELERRRQAELEKQQQRQQAELERRRQAELERQRQQTELERQRQQTELERQQRPQQVELDRQQRIDEILKRNNEILNRE
ncbi:MAG: TonB family protein [Prochloraceae cyanobacterium]|nr:TonB family protein [Prochloraceae cyanobacterium]